VPRSMGRVCLEYLTNNGNVGIVYDKPYQFQSGKPRRAIGDFEVTGRWMIKSQWGETPMASFRIFFDSGHEAIARGIGTGDRCVDSYEARRMVGAKTLPT
jgi:hypothetical protein